MDNATHALTRMNMILHGHETTDTRKGNTLASPCLYQHLMDYWAESMQDDVYAIAQDVRMCRRALTRMWSRTTK